MGLKKTALTASLAGCFATGLVIIPGQAAQAASTTCGATRNYFNYTLRECIIVSAPYAHSTLTISGTGAPVSGTAQTSVDNGSVSYTASHKTCNFSISSFGTYTCTGPTFSVPAPGNYEGFGTVGGTNNATSGFVYVQ